MVLTWCDYVDGNALYAYNKDPTRFKKIYQMILRF